MSGQTPPGWYPDPYGTPGLQRWWDGGKWSDSTQPAAPQASTPAPWTPSGQAAPWPAAQPQRSGGQGALWALVGGGGLVAILLVVAILLATGVFDDSKPVSAPTVSTTSETSPSPEVDVAGRSPVVGTITDSQSGLSFAKLGGNWATSDIPSTSFLNTGLGLHPGQSATVMEAYDGSSPYLATAYPAVVPSALNTGSLEKIAEAWFKKIESDPKVYPAHSVQKQESKSYEVSGRDGWYYRATLNFSQAAEEGWNWRSEDVTVVIVERSGSSPAGLYVSIPDSHVNRADSSLIVESLKVS
jgi:hypothetical protein